MFGMRWMLTVFAINNPQGCRTIVEKWMICRAFLRFQMMLFFYEANGDLIHNNVTNTAIRIVTFFAVIIPQTEFNAVEVRIHYSITEYFMNWYFMISIIRLLTIIDWFYWIDCEFTLFWSPLNAYIYIIILSMTLLLIRQIHAEFSE